MTWGTVELALVVEPTAASEWMAGPAATVYVAHWADATEAMPAQASSASADERQERMLMSRFPLAR